MNRFFLSGVIDYMLLILSLLVDEKSRVCSGHDTVQTNAPDLWKYCEHGILTNNKQKRKKD